MDYLTIALILFLIGAVLLAAEVLLPTGGFLVVSSLLFFALGVGIILTQGTTIEAVVALGGLAVGLPVAGLVAVSAWRRLSLGTILPDDADGSGFASGATEPETLKNHIGKTVSPMRPSGTVEFDGRRIDAMTEGVMLEAGVWVRCVEVKGGRVIVRQIESPADIANLTPDEDEAPGISRGARPAVTNPSPPEPKKPVDDLDDLDLGLDK
ncbi:MAG TPA: NfeD family protein [Gemmata sp.]|jgi:membrane-bound serine protease (ClpP class)|nr:NfeD family protein [Gemmata sp.]